MARNRKGSSRPPVDPAVAAADAEVFASFMRDQAKQERDAKAAARAERRKADEGRRLVQAKEEAAAEVKRLRGSDRATPEEKAAADAAYKAALAAVVAAETGEAPTWAPEAPEETPDAPDDAPIESAPADATEGAEERSDATESADGAEVESETEGPDGDAGDR